MSECDRQCGVLTERLYTTIEDFDEELNAMCKKTAKDVLIFFNKRLKKIIEEFSRQEEKEELQANIDFVLSGVLSQLETLTAEAEIQGGKSDYVIDFSDSITWTNFSLIVHLLNKFSETTKRSVSEELTMVVSFFKTVIKLINMHDSSLSNEVGHTLNNVKEPFQLYFRVCALRKKLVESIQSRSETVRIASVINEAEEQLSTDSDSSQYDPSSPPAIFMSSIEESTPNAHLKSVLYPWGKERSTKIHILAESEQSTHYFDTLSSNATKQNESLVSPSSRLQPFPAILEYENFQAVYSRAPQHLQNRSPVPLWMKNFEVRSQVSSQHSCISFGFAWCHMLLLLNPSLIITVVL